MTGRDGIRDSDGLVAVDRAVAVIEAVRLTRKATLSELSRATGLSEPTMLRYLVALRKHHLVVRDAQGGTYSLGVRLNEWGNAAPADMDPRAVADRPLAELSALLGETVELAGLEGLQLVVMVAAPGIHAVSKTAHVGDSELWHSTSVGKAILSQADPNFVELVLRNLEFPRLTQHTIVSVDQLRQDLEKSRERGYAMDDEESELGLRCVGVAFRSWTHLYTHAISVSGPTYRMPRERAAAVAEKLRMCAREIEAKLGIKDAHDGT